MLLLTDSKPTETLLNFSALLKSSRTILDSTLNLFPATLAPPPQSLLGCAALLGLSTLLVSHSSSSLPESATLYRILHFSAPIFAVWLQTAPFSRLPLPFYATIGSTLTQILLFSAFEFIIPVSSPIILSIVKVTYILLNFLFAIRSILAFAHLSALSLLSVLSI